MLLELSNYENSILFVLLLYSFIFTGSTILDVIVILMYYCQDVQLFHKANNKHLFYHDASNDFYDVVTSIMSLFTRFNWYIFSWTTGFCTFKGATAVANQVLAMFFVPVMVIILGIICLMWHFVIQKKKSSFEQIGHFLWHALFLTLLLTYQGHLVETATLLKCVPFSGGEVFFLNGNMSCMQDWQYVFGMYLVVWLVPFWLILMFGKYLLHKEHLSLPKYILLCLIPLPMGIYLIIQILSRKIRGNVRLDTTKNSGLVPSFLQNSNRRLHFLLNYLCCHGIIVMLRFAMVMTYTYSDNVINGMLAVLGVVFAKLMYTTITLPYSYLR